MVAAAFQIIFRAKMHAHDVFLFFKNYFWHQHIKTIQNVQTILNFSKKKKFKIFWKRGLNHVPKHFLNGTRCRGLTGKGFVFFLCIRVRFSLYMHVTLTMLYMPTELVGCSLDLGISCGTRKLTRTPRVIYVYISVNGFTFFLVSLKVSGFRQSCENYFSINI